VGLDQASTTVLLNVEDNDVSRYARSRIFRQAGFDVLEARSGQEALDLVGRTRPEIVVLDVHLPDMSGLEVCRQIKANASTGSVLVLHLTASAFDVQKKVAGLEAGADSYLVEPVDPDELVATVRALLRLRSAEEAARAAAAEAEAARAEAEAANRAKDEFLATVSHELRTPLDAILGWVQVLRARQTDETTLARALETIERNARIQATLIGDILDASRIISGKLRLELRPLELAPIVEAALEVVRPAAEAKEIRLETTLDASPGLVAGDPGRLQQVIWNLLSNAIKFTPKRGQVRIRLVRIDSELSLTVSDTGQGISPEFLPHVFDRFQQADTGTARSHGGLGLGLAIVRHLVELHGGSVQAASPGPGQGATFSVMLPVLALTDTQAAEAHGVGSAPAAPMLTGVRVLVVDDEPDARTILSAVLEQRGAVADTAASPDEALAALQGARYDVLVSDLAMPGQDGYALIRRVRALPAEAGGRIPAVALTAHVGAEERTRVVQAGFQMHVAKPVDAVELTVVVANLAGLVAGR
jgi:signal transduction histidine kinase